MGVHAAISGDLDLLKLAVLHDPLVGAVCTPDEVWQMVDEMVVAQAAWLPQYAHAIAGAKERLSRATVPTRDWKGAASRPVRTMDEIRAERRAAQ
jgi:alpha-galactosidase